MIFDKKSGKNQAPPKPKPPLPTEDPSLILKTSSNLPIPSARPYSLLKFLAFAYFVALLYLLVAIYLLLQYLK